MEFEIVCADVNRLESSKTMSMSEPVQSVVDLEQLIAITNVPIFCIDNNGSIVTSNSEFATVMGYNREELLGKNVARVTFAYCFDVINIALKFVFIRILLRLMIDIYSRSMLSVPVKDKK
jgi:PAS domain-containing protein